MPSLRTHNELTLHLQILARKEDLRVDLYCERALSCPSLCFPNLLQGFAADALRQLSSLPPWPPADFDQGRQRLGGVYPNIDELWRTLPIHVKTRPVA